MEAKREGDKLVTEIGRWRDGRRVTMEVDPRQQAMAQLKQEQVPLYDVPALREEEKSLRRQADELRGKAAELDQQAGEMSSLVIVCGRRDRELAVKGMVLRNGRIEFIDGDNL